MAASFLSVALLGSTLLAAINAQNSAGGDYQSEVVAFQHFQPLNTTILTEYGSSPAVYPSRK
jgi:beta-glucosidase